MLDITGADALSVILDHVTKMEHWNAYAELNRDLNTYARTSVSGLLVT